MNADYNVKEVQGVLLGILNQFQRICRKYNLKYMAIYGTCIGAVRHNGFIPWDDDMDVIMPLEDYLKFREIVNDELDSGYELFNPKDHEHFYMNALFLHDVRTTSVGNNWKNYPDCYKGISIDILPVSGLPKGRIRQYGCAILLGLWIIRSRMFRLPLDGQEGLAQKMMWFICNATRKRNIPINYFTEKIERFFSKYRFDESDKVIFMTKWRMKDVHSYGTYYNIHDFEDFEDVIEIPFENTSIPVPKGYDHYMKREYGNYMKLPPINQQIANHENAIVDVNKTYKEYAAAVQ